MIKNWYNCILTTHVIFTKFIYHETLQPNLTFLYAVAIPLCSSSSTRAGPA